MTDSAQYRLDRRALLPELHFAQAGNAADFSHPTGSGEPGTHPRVSRDTTEWRFGVPRSATWRRSGLADADADISLLSTAAASDTQFGVDARPRGKKIRLHLRPILALLNVCRMKWSPRFPAFARPLLSRDVPASVQCARNESAII